MRVTSESIVEEMKAEHGILSIAVPCKCLGKDGNPVLRCLYCDGTGKVQYEIHDVRFFS